MVLLFSLGLLPLCSLGLDFTCPLRGGSVVAWGYCGFRRIVLRLFDWLVSVSLFGLLQSVPYLATISAGHRVGALTFLGHWVSLAVPVLSASVTILSIQVFCCQVLVSVNRVTCSLLYRCFGSLTCQIVCLSARTYQTDRGFLPTSRPPYYMVAHGVRARGRYLIVCAESDYSTCDRPPSVARVGVVGATISGWFGLVNPYRLWLLSHSLVSLGLRRCSQPLMLLCPYSTMVVGGTVNLPCYDLCHIT